MKVGFCNSSGGECTVSMNTQIPELATQLCPYDAASSGMNKGTCAGLSENNLPTAEASDLVVPPEYFDSDSAPGVLSVRVKFRGAEDESAMTGYKVCGTKAGLIQSWTCGDEVPKKGLLASPPITGTGFSTGYNRTTGQLLISNRGFYENGDSAQMTLKGPGTLTAMHVDMEPG